MKKRSVSLLLVLFSCMLFAAACSSSKDAGSQQNNGTQQTTFSDTFQNWKGKELVNATDLATTLNPLVVQGQVGDFSIEKKTDANGTILHVVPTADPAKDKMVIQIGYQLISDSLGLKATPGKTVTLTIKARCSDSKAVSLFLQDKKEIWEATEVPVDGSEWKEYKISRTIRDGASEATAGLNWKPATAQSWFEIQQVNFTCQ